MAAPDPGGSRFYRDITSQMNTRIENIHTSIRSLCHGIVDRINRLDPRTNAATNSIINNDIESSENLSNSANSETTNTNVAPSNMSTSTATSECQASNHSNASSSRHSNRRSSRRARGASFQHSYPHGLISIRTLEKDRNVLAAILSIVVIVIIATALAQFKWFSVYNDMCDSHFYSKTESTEKDVNGNYDQILDQHASLRQQPFVNSRPFHSGYPTPAPVLLYGFAPGYKLGCSTPPIIALKRTIIGLCFLAIMCSMIQFFLDIMGARRKWVNKMRTHAVGNIITVLLCVLIIGLCYFVSILYERQQLHNFFRKLRPASLGMLKTYKPLPLDKTQYEFLTVHQVKFELSYYLITLAGFLSILAAAANLFRRPRQILIERISHSRHRNRLNGDESSLLASDLLSNESTGYFPFYHPNNWMFNPNWSSFYNLDPANTTNSNDSSRPANISFAPPVSTCPPPPPYSP